MDKYKCVKCNHIDIWWMFYYEEIVQDDDKIYPLICPKCGNTAKEGEKEDELFVRLEG